MGRWGELVEQKHATIDPDEFEHVDDYTRIGSTRIGDIWISTVWLGLNHNFFDGPPLIFETMIFGGNLDQEMWRYSTVEEARAGHAFAVNLAQLDMRATQHKADLIRGVVFLAGVGALIGIVAGLK